jgi:hypothetical protein
MDASLGGLFKNLSDTSVDYTYIERASRHNDTNVVQVKDKVTRHDSTENHASHDPYRMRQFCFSFPAQSSTDCLKLKLKIKMK